MTETLTPIPITSSLTAIAQPFAFDENSTASSCGRSGCRSATSPQAARRPAAEPSGSPDARQRRSPAEGTAGAPSAPGRSGEEKHRDCPRSEAQERPRRPRPLVCFSAVTQRKPASPARARARHSLLVDGVSDSVSCRKSPSDIRRRMGDAIKRASRAASSAAPPIGPPMKT